MKLVLAIWFGMALCAFAQTMDLTPTNSTTPSPKSVQSERGGVVTKEMVLKGLTTISNQIAEANISIQKMVKQINADKKRLQLSIGAGLGGDMEGYDLINAKYAPAGKALSQKIAVLQLQEFNIRERYEKLLTTKDSKDVAK